MNEEHGGGETTLTENQDWFGDLRIQLHTHISKQTTLAHPHKPISHSILLASTTSSSLYIKYSVLTGIFTCNYHNTGILGDLVVNQIHTVKSFRNYGPE